MTGILPDSDGYADATDNALEKALPLPALPPGKKYGPRIGVWGPYSIVDDAAEADDLRRQRGHAREISPETKGDRRC